MGKNRQECCCQIGSWGRRRGSDSDSSSLLTPPVGSARKGKRKRVNRCRSSLEGASYENWQGGGGRERKRTVVADLIFGAAVTGRKKDRAFPEHADAIERGGASRALHIATGKKKKGVLFRQLRACGEGGGKGKVSIWIAERKGGN